MEKGRWGRVRGSGLGLDNPSYLWEFPKEEMPVKESEKGELLAGVGEKPGSEVRQETVFQEGG